ncbi:MAG: hypothetical protein HYW78_00120 [Parcubacteria group bacterium]|nr:hypothetical protein [Parcubacteria group bacterium]
MSNKEKYQKNVGIIGYGEVGKAIAQFYENPKIKDLDRDDGLEGVEILHICIPYNNAFIETVVSAIKRIKPLFATIIHSTVAPGTTKKIIDSLPSELNSVVHSPIRGVHPYLFEGIQTFVKYIGAEDEFGALKVQEHLESLGIKTKIVYPAAATELAKLLDTTYYGLCIAWHGEMKKICEQFGVDFNTVATDFNTTYNEGYEKLGKKNVIRPVLTPPDGPIGGHCVIPNVYILLQFFESEAFDLILKYELHAQKK